MCNRESSAPLSRMWSLPVLAPVCPLGRGRHPLGLGPAWRVRTLAVAILSLIRPPCWARALRVACCVRGYARG
eukprot:8865795-Alexandrium_andersonii.AAC.3